MIPISIDANTSRIETHNPLDWQGTSKGILPCADCEGIETEITLNANLYFSH